MYIQFISFKYDVNFVFCIYFLFSKIVRKDGGQIDRNRDIEDLWEFNQRYKRRHRLEDMQRVEKRMRESGTFSAKFGAYVHFLV